MAEPVRKNSPWPLTAALAHLMSASLVHAAKEDMLGDEPCAVRLLCSVTVSNEDFWIGAAWPVCQCEHGPYDCRRKFVIEDPAFFRSHQACRDGLRRMLARTLGLDQYDHSPYSWYVASLHSVAAGIVGQAGEVPDEPRGYSFTVSLSVRVRIMFVEVGALMLVCKEAAAQAAAQLGGGRPAYCGDQCAICMEDFAGGDKDQAVINLPCHHAFHGPCLVQWFRNTTSCPLCRRDMIGHLDAVLPAVPHRRGPFRHCQLRQT